MTITESQIKQKIKQALQHFESGNLKDDAISLLETLGYYSERSIEIETPEDFLDRFDPEDKLNPDNALFDQWESVELLFQLTGDEIEENEQMSLIFEVSDDPINDRIIKSFLFLALKLQSREYSRTKLSKITREINKLTNMPAIILFQHGPYLTLSVIDRRLHKRDSSKDVLEKVTLIKDISIAEPHRAHVEILFELSLNQLFQKYRVTNFVELYDAWQKTLDISELNKRFYKELADWYFWAVDRVTFPEGAGDDEETRNATSVIRLITRLIFIWFIEEKGLVPENLFDKTKLNEILDFGEPNESRYYKAILQNLFFATLNTEMNTEQETNREFRGTRKSGRDLHYMSHSLYRYERYFKEPEAFLELVEDIPFLNGGIFECLDKKDDQGNVIRIDGFSDRDDNPISVPDYLFFASEREVNLNSAYGTKNKRYKVRGLINILKSYKFTVEENALSAHILYKYGE